MKPTIGCGRKASIRSRSVGQRCAIAALPALALVATGCNQDEVVRAFRAGASDQLQAGVESIALGVINGAFSAFDVGTDDSGSANTSGATTGADTTDTTTETTETP